MLRMRLGYGLRLDRKGKLPYYFQLRDRSSPVPPYNHIWVDLDRHATIFLSRADAMHVQESIAHDVGEREQVVLVNLYGDLDNVVARVER